MKKRRVCRQVTEAGDAVITYRSQNSRRLKYNVCTLDFDNKYIQAKGIAQNPHRDKFYCSVGMSPYRLLQPENVIYRSSSTRY